MSVAVIARATGARRIAGHLTGDAGRSTSIVAACRYETGFSTAGSPSGGEVTIQVSVSIEESSVAIGAIESAIGAFWSAVVRTGEGR
jgi:hypothetical protein